MDGYKHYIRINSSNVIIHRFSSAFEEPQPGDICVNENGGRHYNEPIVNERGQYDRKWLDDEELPRSQEELDMEWLERPPDPPTELDIIGQMLVEKDIQLMQIQSDNDVLGQQLVEIDIRMMMGGI